MEGQLKEQARLGMEVSLEAFTRALSKVRAGRATPALLEGIKVESYGNLVPLNQVGNVGNEDNRTLVINVWDKAQLQAVEKAILASNLGLNPSTSGQSVRVVLPPLTEESRKSYIKQVSSEAEQAKVSIRNVRKEVLQKAKQLQKEGQITEDSLRRTETLIQKETDDFVARVEAALETKEKELRHI